MSRLDRVFFGRRLAVGLSLALTITLAVPALSAAEKSDSLDWVPEDAAFYSSSRRMREQVDILLASNAAKKVQEIPTIKMGLAMLKAQLDDPTQPAGMVKAFFDLPENAQLIKLLTDMHSEEIMVYGDGNWIDAFKLLREFNKVTNKIQVDQVRQIQQNFDFDDDDDDDAEADDVITSETAMGRAYIEFLKANLDHCKIPTTVIAFRLKENVPAETQLKRLEVIAKVAFAQVPQLKDAISRKKIDGTEYVTFSFEAKHLPWEEFPLEDLEKKKGEYKKVFDHLKSLKVVGSIGVWNNWLVVSIAADDEHLAKLGQGKSLRARKEFAKLAAYKDKRLTSIAYASGEFMNEVSNWKRQIDDLVDMANVFLPLAELPEPLKKRIAKDVKELGEDIKAGMPEPGAALSFSYLTKNGYDFRGYSWAKGSPYDSSKRLSILDHVGGSPILAIAARGKYKPVQYDTVRKWVKKGHKYFEDVALPNLSGDERKQYDKVAEHVYPLIRRLDQTTKKKLIPALADGQSALVLDAKFSSPQWAREMPKAAAPLPIPEPALLIGVSDAKLLKEAMIDYHKIASDAVKIAREISPEEIPPFEIPSLTEKAIENGNMYFYPIPAELYREAGGLDQRLLPNFGLSKTVATAALSKEHTQRLLKATPLVSTGPLAKRDRKVAMAVYFNWAAVVDAATPWVEYGFAVATMEGAFGPRPDGATPKDVSGVKLPPPAEAILSQVRVGLDVLKCFRTFEGVTYQDGDVWVSEGHLHVVDVKP